ncbi:MAG: putative peptide maturation dehydrogenase [Gaiellales bacterium]
MRRTVYAFFHRYDAPILAAEELVQGNVEIRRDRRLLAISILRGTEFVIADADFELLAQLPSDRWVDVEDLPPDDRPRIAQLAEQGLVVSTAADPLLTELRRRDEHLASGHWNIYAALFHSLSTWRDVDLRRHFADPAELPLQADDAVAEFVARHGPPPPHFHRVGRGDRVVELPLARREGGVFGALRSRKTTRAFDQAAPLTLEELGVVLYEVFGCHGLVAIGGEVTALKKTSPSGGSLHPIEAYALVRNVDGVEPGLYHYRTDDHALERLEALTTEEAERVAAEFTCGQTYWATAAVSFILVARFRRSFWKYRKHQRSYSVLLLDAGHLSQTLYLVSAELGLGAFVTTAINGANIEERLGLDPFDQGALAVTGCGRPAREPTPLEPTFVPFVPRRSAR